jgi:hypothetical protein
MSLEKSIEDLNRSVGTLCDRINKLVEMGGPADAPARIVEPDSIAESIAAGEEQAPEPEKAEEAEPTATVTADDLKAQFVALVNAKGSAAMHAILKDFGAAKLSGIKPEQYGAVAEAIEQAMGAE